MADVFIVLFAVKLGIVGVDVGAYCWGCNYSKPGLPSKLGFFRAGNVVDLVKPEAHCFKVRACFMGFPCCFKS